MIRLVRAFSIFALVVGVALFAAAEIHQRVNEDDTLPTITADSDTIEVPCDYTSEQLLAGMSAFDEVDGDLTSQILVGNFTRFIEPGVCDLSYVVFDSSEHMATISRQVRFSDYHSPRFWLSAPLCFEEGASNISDTTPLVHANDMLDGDLTDWVSYVETNGSYSVAGDYTITFKVQNSFGDTSQTALPMHIYEKGTQDFTFELTQPLVYLEQGGQIDPLSYIESVRDLSGEAYDPSLLQVTSTVDSSTPGVYEIHYEIGKNAEPSAPAADEEESAQEDETAEADTESGEDDLLDEIGDDKYGQIWLTVIVEEALS